MLREVLRSDGIVLRDGGAPPVSTGGRAVTTPDYGWNPDKLSADSLPDRAGGETVVRVWAIGLSVAAVFALSLVAPETVYTVGACAAGFSFVAGVAVATFYTLYHLFG